MLGAKGKKEKKQIHRPDRPQSEVPTIAIQDNLFNQESPAYEILKFGIIFSAQSITVLSEQLVRIRLWPITFLINVGPTQRGCPCAAK